MDSALITSNLDDLNGVVTLSGHDACAVSSADLLEAMGLPGGLLPLENVVDCGFNKDTGFVWIKQKQKSQHYFKKIGKTVSYDTEVRGYLEKNRLRNVSGVKSKELLIWAPVGDVTVHGSGSGNEKIKFKSYGGISRSFPAEAFAREE